MNVGDVKQQKAISEDGNLTRSEEDKITTVTTACQDSQSHNLSLSRNLQNEDKTTSDDNTNEKKKQTPIKKESSIGLRQLFRYADRTDYLTLFFGICAALIHGLCFALYLLLFGRLTGIFAIKSSDDHCQNQNLSTILNKQCPLGIDISSSKSVYLNKLCKNAINRLSTSSPVTTEFRTNIMMYIYWLLVISTIQLISASLRHFLFDSTAKRQASRIRVRLFQSILQRNISYFDGNPIGQVNSKLFDNIDKINSAIGFDLSTIIQLIASTIAIVIIGFIINWKLTLIMICLIPLVILSVHLFAKITTKEAIKEFIAYSKAGHIVQEVFSSLRTVLSLNGSKFEQKRYAKELESCYWNSIRKGVALGILIGWLYFTTYLIYALAFISGVLLIPTEEHHRSMISDILVIAISFGQCISLVGLIGPFLQTYAEARAVATPVFKLIDETEGVDAIQTEKWDNNQVKNEAVDLNGDIRFDNVNFVYPSREDVSVLRNLTFVARAGETTALVGPSGSGKSTCMSLLLRYYEPLSGEITINEQPLSDCNIKQLRKHIGIVSQEPILFGTSIYENIRYGKENASRGEIEEAAKQANAHYFIMKLPNKYGSLVGESGVQLSGGEKQRIALARALVKQPTLLLMDEATSALDNSSEKIVQEALDRACKGRTTIVIAHRLSTIRNAHRIYLFSNGTIVEQGTHDTLMNQEGSKYQEMIKIQMVKEIEIDQNDQNVNRIELNDEDNEKQSFEDTDLLHKDQTVDIDQKRSSRVRSTFLRLLSMNKPEWAIILIGCIICIIVGMTQPLFAILLTGIVRAFEGCTYEEQRNQVIKFSVLFLLLGLLCVVLRFFQFGAFAMSGTQLTKRVRLRAFENLLRQEVGFFDRPNNSSGAISTRLSSDAMAVQQMIGTRFGIVFETVAMLTFGLIIGYLFNWKLASVFLLFVIFVFLLVFLDIHIQTKVNTYNYLILEQSSSLVVGAIDNIRTVKQFVLEKEFLRQYTELINKSYLIRRKYSLITAIIFGMYWSSILFQMASIYALTLVLLEQKEIEMSDVIKVFAFASFFSQSTRVISSLSKEMGASVSAARNFFDLFDRTPSIDNGSIIGKELTDFRGEIKFDQIKFAYPSRPTSYIFDNFQLTIEAGQRVAIVGASGCGKSTLIQLLERFYDVIDGQILLDGVDIRQLNLHWIRSRLGLVSQEPILFDLTINENIAYGLENISQEQIFDAAIKANIHQFIQTLPNGYETRVGSKGNQLSGGEKQRIAIARILVRQPKVLLLDEATSALDSYNEQIVQKSIEEIEKDDSRRTLIIIAHRLSTIQSCDMIFVLDRGYLLESGTHTELIQRRGVYYQMLIDNS